MWLEALINPPLKNTVTSQESNFKGAPINVHRE
jgi:hypothetical protein